MRSSTSVGFARVLGSVPMAVRCGVLLAGLGFFVAVATTLDYSGEDAARTIAIGALLLLPVILATLERATETHRGGTAYDIARRDGSPTRLFVVGWLTLGGCLVASAFVVQVIAARIDIVIDRYLGWDVPLILFALPLAAAAVIGRALPSPERTHARDVLGGLALAALAATVAFVSLFPPEEVAGGILERQTGQHWLTGAAALGLTLWVVELVLEERGQFRKSDRALAGVVLASFGFVTLFSVLAAFTLATRPDLIARIQGGAVSVGRDQLRLVGLVITVVLCGLTLSRVLGRGLRLAATMTRDQLLPAPPGQGVKTPVHRLVVAGATISLIAGFVPVNTITSVGAVTALGTAFLLIGTGLIRKTRDPSRLRLPLYPLVHVVALGSCGFLAAIAPHPGLGIVAGWLVLGGIVRVTFRRPVDLLTETQDSRDVAEDGAEATPDVPTPVGRRILLCPRPQDDPIRIARVAASAAAQGNGDVLLLHVVGLLSDLPRSEVRRRARRELERLEEIVREAGETDAPITVLVRIAPTVAEGILDAARTHSADAILFAWPDGDADRDVDAADHRDVIEFVLAAAPVAVAVIDSRIGDAPRRVVVGTAGGPDAPAALTLGAALAHGGSLELVHVHAPSIDTARAQETLDATLAEAALDGVKVTCRLVANESPQAGLLEAASGCDALLLGCTRDRILDRTGTAGLWADTREAFAGSTILVRRKEPRRALWLRSAWNLALLGAPKLSMGERRSVFGKMSGDAKADIDFYVLIVLSSTIATFGLFQDSAAVIIGAMLVAPLMSPIVAIAHGVVQGNRDMVRTALASTLKGAFLAVSVATAFALLLPTVAPTGQILARVAPTLLDLGVGLAAGGAAAYGVSRKSVAAALPGVAISVALVPPLCVVGIGLGMDRFDVATGALLLFLTNLGGIVFVSAIVFLLLGFQPVHDRHRVHLRTSLLLTVTGVLALSVPLTLSSVRTTRVQQIEALVEAELHSEAAERDFAVASVHVERDGDVYVVRAVLLSPSPVDVPALHALREEIEKGTGTRVRLEAQVVNAQFLNSEGGK